MVEYKNCKKKLPCIQPNQSTHCNGFQTIVPTISPEHIFIEIIFWKGENIEHSNDAGCTMDIKLCDIPQILNLDSVAYELRGVIHYRRARTYVKRCGKNWELFDDLKKKAVPIKETTKVSCELLLYTILAYVSIK
ncbi:Uncharacterized protein FWK35_00027913 [Aphis craccivora]|uniref:Uncharacterized protein n=1 Tax=Aphis craccivora TaxID=307492 RepID=A0A6G0VTN9_APHCR|nr:Uncharacterized protein FWK35_00027913 [Aphis craccivora]